MQAMLGVADRERHRPPVGFSAECAAKHRVEKGGMRVQHVPPLSLLLLVLAACMHS